ncbi:MAG: hypothetical protein V1888_02940 [archaeon]
MKNIINKNIIILVLSIIILSIAGLYLYNNITDKYYYQGMTDANSLIYENIVNSLNEQGSIMFNVYDGNQTIPIKLIPYIEDESEK